MRFKFHKQCRSGQLDWPCGMQVAEAEIRNL